MHLVLSSLSKASFITLCSQSTSLGMLVGLVLGGNGGWVPGEMLASSGVFDAACREGEGLSRMVFRSCSGVASSREAHEEVVMASGAAESIPFKLRGSSTLVEGRAPKAADGGFLQGMLC